MNKTFRRIGSRKKSSVIPENVYSEESHTVTEIKTEWTDIKLDFKKQTNKQTNKQKTSCKAKYSLRRCDSLGHIGREIIRRYSRQCYTRPRFPTIF